MAHFIRFWKRCQLAFLGKYANLNAGEKEESKEFRILGCTGQKSSDQPSPQVPTTPLRDEVDLPDFEHLNGCGCALEYHDCDNPEETTIESYLVEKLRRSAAVLDHIRLWRSLNLHEESNPELVRYHEAEFSSAVRTLLKRRLARSCSVDDFSAFGSN